MILECRRGALVACAVAVVATVSACTLRAPGEPEIVEVDPSVIANDAPRAIEVIGRHLSARIEANLDSPSSSTVDTRFVATISGPQTAALQSAFLSSADRVSAVVPAGLTPGSYALTLVDGRGRAASLTSALRIVFPECTVDSDCDDGDPCTTHESCVAHVCKVGARDKDADGDGYVDAACGGNDCDDDPAACGASCSPGLLEGPAGASSCSDGYDNDCSGRADAQEPSCAASGSGCFVVTLGTGGVLARDTSLHGSAPDATYGANAHITVGDTAVQAWRGLLAFDVSSIPPSATVEAAKITLTRTSANGGSAPVAMYRVTKAWDDAAATWNAATDAQAWTTPGGDFDAAALSTQDAGAGSRVTFDASSLVDAWVHGAAENDGVLFKGPEDTAVTTNFCSAEEPDLSLRPHLTIEYCLP